MMFGPNDDSSPNSKISMNYRVKRESNDSLRQRFIDVTVPQAEFLGLTIPDKDLKWNEERQHYDFGELPWDEFMTILKGNGPCNKKRLQTKVKAQQENLWVKEAAAAFAEKQEKISM
jgi:ring-1,2-phenylacetyl-CoA epoxidase subunit PaaA